jgi:hypothetical protein
MRILGVNCPICDVPYWGLDCPYCANVALEAQVEELTDLLVSAHCIAQRKGADTAWDRFDARLTQAGIGSITAKVFKVLPSDLKATIAAQSRRIERLTEALEEIALFDEIHFTITVKALQDIARAALAKEEHHETK